MQTISIDYVLKWEIIWYFKYKFIFFVELFNINNFK